ncbi:hypothetical protein LTS18_014033, partial [Coniosporium uncinatum]
GGIYDQYIKCRKLSKCRDVYDLSFKRAIKSGQRYYEANSIAGKANFSPALRSHQYAASIRQVEPFAQPAFKR